MHPVVVPRRRMSRGQLALTLVLVALSAGVQLWAYQTFDALSETNSRFGLARDITGTIADAQRDALRTQVLVEQLDSSGATVADARRQVGFLAQQLRVAREQVGERPGRAKLDDAIASQQALAADLDALGGAGHDEVLARLPQLRSEASSLESSLRGLYGSFETTYYDEQLGSIAHIRFHQRWLYFGLLSSASVAIGLTLSMRRSVRREFERAYGLLVHETTERAAAEEAHSRALEHLAYHDPLTGRANRVRLERALQALPEEGSGAVVFVDLDEFKVINDSFGHEEGDAVLCRVALAIESSVRDADLVAHYGGDEFTVVLTDTEDAGAVAAANRIRDAVAAVRLGNGRRAGLTCSVGVAVAPLAEVRGEDLLRRAARAVHEARGTGRGRVVLLDEARYRRTEHTVETAAKLSKALALEELYLEYQPIIPARGGRTGAEALLRWRHGGGVVSPGEFVPIAEDAGLIDEIGTWALERACQDLARWQLQHGAGSLYVSVNVSAHQLRDPDYVARVADIVVTSGVDPGDLVLELTESAMLDEPERAPRVLRELKTLGVRVALDDFGTGYSSLSQLLHLPVDVLKIDKAFLADVTENVRTRQFLGAIIDLAHDLHMQVTIEGVEDERQLVAVVEAGCDQLQGYFFARPKAVADLEAWMVEHLAVVGGGRGPVLPGSRP